MKILALFVVMICLSSAVAFTFGRSRTIRREHSVRHTAACEHDKQEKEDNEVKVKLEITGSDCDGYDLIASNPQAVSRDCTFSFKLEGHKKNEPPSLVLEEIKREGQFKVSDDRTSSFNVKGESSLPVIKLLIDGFELKCK